MSLKRKVSEQAAELNHLRQLTSPDISSASEATPDGPAFSFLPPRGPFRKSPIYSSPTPAPREQDIPHFLKGVDQVRLQNAKLQSDAGGAALKLMDCLFSTEQMVNGNPSGVTRSKDAARQKTIKRLDPEKMRYIDSKLKDIGTIANTIRPLCFLLRYSTREMGCDNNEQGDQAKNDTKMY